MIQRVMAAVPNQPICGICQDVILQTKQRRKLNPLKPGVNEDVRRFYGDFVNPAFKTLPASDDYYVCLKDLRLDKAQKAQATMQTIIRDMKLSIGVAIIETSASESELKSNEESGAAGTVSSGLSGFSKLPEGDSSPPLMAVGELPVSKGVILGRRKPSAVSSRFGEPVSKRKRIEKRSIPTIPKSARYTPSALYKTPQSQVKVTYVKPGKKPRKYIIPSTCKKLVKSIRYRRYPYVARTILQIPKLKDATLSEVVKVIHAECNSLCSIKTKPSELRYVPNANQLADFKWDKVMDELSERAPTLSVILKAAAERKHGRHKAKPCAIGMAAALLMKSRNTKMSRAQAVNSIVLFAGHANKKVYTRLNQLGICTSHKTTTLRVMELAENHDEPVLKWKADCESAHYVAQSTIEGATSNDTANGSGSDVDSDDEEPGSEDEEPGSDDEILHQLRSSTPSGEHQDITPPENQLLSATLKPPNYILVGDNWDKNVRPRHMTMEHGTTSLHLFHAYAIESRVDSTKLIDDKPVAELKQMSALAFLPSMEDCAKLRDNYVTLVARVVVEKLPAFKQFRDCVQAHIPHPYSEAMKQKSTVIPLGVIPKNENTKEGMIDIMDQLHNYVPTMHSPDDIEKMQLKVLFGGDQLTATIARKSQITRLNSDTERDALRGVVPFASDWHAEFNLMEVIFNRLYKNESSQEGGTLLQLRNLINRRNISRNISGKFNAALDFLFLMATCHIIAAALHFFGMNGRDAVPTLNAISSEVLKQPLDIRCKVFLDRIGHLVDRYIIATDYNVLVQSQLPSPLQRSPALPMQGDNPHTARVVMEHSYAPPQTPTEPQPKKRRQLPPFLRSLRDEPHTSPSIMAKSPDGIFNYAAAVLNDTLLLMELRDAIHEGDGDRIIRAWKFMLIYYRYGNHTNYALEAFHLQCMVNTVASPRVAHQLTWSRTMNAHGGPGCNIPVDLHNEHLNRILKNSVGDMGSNISEKAIVKRSKSLKGVINILDTFDSNTSVHPVSTHHSMSSQRKDEDAVLQQLLKTNVFEYTPGRTHKSFRSVLPNVSGHINASKFFQWLNEQKQKALKQQELIRVFEHSL